MKDGGPWPSPTPRRDCVLLALCPSGWWKRTDLQFRVRRLLDVEGGLLFHGPSCKTIGSPVFPINVAFFKNVSPADGNTAVEPQNG
uniref:Uncharacterized protein n=1 Tax=Timema shepardi TaxID=629360 RepID=A0A7R9ARL8_TIMSH|nr:unnamed protein product [Timema shepardi]